MPSLPHALSRSTGAGVPDPCPRRERRGGRERAVAQKVCRPNQLPQLKPRGEREGWEGVGGAGNSAGAPRPHRPHRAPPCRGTAECPRGVGTEGEGTAAWRCCPVLLLARRFSWSCSARQPSPAPRPGGQQPPSPPRLSGSSPRVLCWALTPPLALLSSNISSVPFVFLSLWDRNHTHLWSFMD